MFLKDLWYFAMHGEKLKPGQHRHKVLLGEPVLIGRAHDGKVFAFIDTCPHRGILLSSGKMLKNEEGESRVECPYHGWQFGPDGGCRHIPSLVPDQDLDPTRIRNRAFPCKEVNGNIWIYVASDPKMAPEPICEPPIIPGIENAQPRLFDSATFSCAIDHAVIGLMDPAHGPFVHGSWWWRTSKSIHEKSKAFGPTPRGFAMKTHKPSSNSSLYKLLGGDVTTEISFQIPGIRIEHIKAGRYTVVGLTTVTPITEDETEVTQTFYWNLAWLGLLNPLLRMPMRTFLKQDRDAVNEQQKGLKFNPRLMLIDDADQQAKWYHRLKKEWADSRQEGRPFSNPVKDTVLRWRS